MSRQAHYENGIIHVPSKDSVPETIRRLVRSFIESAGFEAIDAGPLQNARSLQPMGMLNIWFGYTAKRGTGIAPTWLTRA